MQEKSVLTGHLSELKQKIENGLEELKSSKELYEFKSEYLEGKKSKISGLMKEMKNKWKHVFVRVFQEKN